MVKGIILPGTGRGTAPHSGVVERVRPIDAVSGG
jgi:hypothetical protein